MKLITRNTDYAIRALCYLAKQEGKSATVVDLVAELGIPRPFLRKILQMLSAEGILRSFKGAGGGFLLCRRPANIPLTELIHIFQNTIHLNECVFKKKICPNRSTCVLKKEIDAIETDVLNRLERITIASLLKNGKKTFRR